MSSTTTDLDRNVTSHEECSLPSVSIEEIPTLIEEEEVSQPSRMSSLSSTSSTRRRQDFDAREAGREIFVGDSSSFVEISI